MVRDGDIWGDCTDYQAWGLLHHATSPVVFLILEAQLLGGNLEATNTGQNDFFFWFCKKKLKPAAREC